MGGREHTTRRNTVEKGIFLHSNYGAKTDTRHGVCGQAPRGVEMRRSGEKGIAVPAKTNSGLMLQMNVENHNRKQQKEKPKDS